MTPETLRGYREQVVGVRFMLGLCYDELITFGGAVDPRTPGLAWGAGASAAEVDEAIVILDQLLKSLDRELGAGEGR
jgi:hypothetical protein